jgi:hypothetical protein
MFQRAVSHFSAGRKSWNSCSNEGELLDRCQMLDRLYDDMSANGYRPQYLLEWKNSVRGASVPDETRVAITQEGQVVRCAAGRHRVAMAKLLGLSEIPALVQIKHTSAPLVGDLLQTILIK